MAKTKQKPRKLTEKQKRFVEEYTSNGGNACQAVIDAGYNVKNRDVAIAIGVENLVKPCIEQELAIRRAEIERKLEENTEITVERQLLEYESLKKKAISKLKYDTAKGCLDSQTRIIGGFERDNMQQGDKTIIITQKERDMLRDKGLELIDV
jgi:phage terminase small subunit